MKKISNLNLPILLATVYLFVYLVILYFSINFNIALLMLSLSPLLLLWMVIRVLKGNYTCKVTFEESFYEDWSGKTDGIQ